MKLSYSFNLSRACAILGYSRQAYYKPLVEKSIIEAACLDKLCSQANDIRKRCPTRGCRAMYEKFGSTLPVGRDKTIELLMNLGYRVRYAKRYGRATQAGTREFPNLLVNKKVNRINEVWQADMAHYLYGDRKYYTIYITDVYSQDIVGYGAFDSNKALNYTQVLHQAIGKCRRLTNGLKGLIHHSDGGMQYESRGYKKLCSRNGIVQSMCMYSYENPYAEKTNDIINNGYLNVWQPRTLDHLRACQKKAVKDHNENSKKKVLGKLSPNEFKNLYMQNQLGNYNYELNLKPQNPEQPRRRKTIVI